MKTWHIVVALIVLILVAGGFVLFVGISPKPIPKINLSQFESADVVVNSLFAEVQADIENPSIFFLGIDISDANDPMMQEVFEKFWTKIQQSKHPFGAVLIDQSINPVFQISAEHFSLKAEPERFVSGLKTAESNGIHLLVIVPPIEASPKISNSLISLARKSIYVSEPGKVGGLVFSTFPRLRREEEFFTIPCNTGEEDGGGTAKLGCYIIQKARSAYRKRFPVGTHIGYLDQLGLSEFVFLLAREPASETP